MTTAYPARGAHILEALTPGDQLTAKVVSSGGSYWLEDIAVTQR
jgi:hypothetical protein